MGETIVKNECYVVSLSLRVPVDNNFSAGQLKTFMNYSLFKDLESAGHQLAGVVETNGGCAAVVLAIANSGVPVAIPIANKLHAPLETIVIRRLFVRDGGALPVCAVNVAGNLLTESESVLRSDIEKQFVADAIESMSRRVAQMRGSVPPNDFSGSHALLVDNGIHTGSTIEIAIAAVRRLRPSRITVAIPVGDAQIKNKVESLADAVTCLKWVENFGHTGLWYRHFNRPSDDCVKVLLERSVEWT